MKKRFFLILISILITACYGQALDLMDTVDSITPTSVSYNVTWDDDSNTITYILNQKGVFSSTIIDFSSTETAIFLVSYNRTEGKIKSYSVISGDVGNNKNYTLSFGIDDQDRYDTLAVYDSNGNGTADLTGDEILLISNQDVNDFSISILGENLKTMVSSGTSIDIIVYNCKINGSSISNN